MSAMRSRSTTSGGAVYSSSSCATAPAAVVESVSATHARVPTSSKEKLRPLSTSSSTVMPSTSRETTWSGTTILMEDKGGSISRIFGCFEATVYGTDGKDREGREGQEGREGPPADAPGAGSR